MPRGGPEFVQPPWVWGPSEVNAWINAVYPSRRRPATRSRRARPRVGRLRLRLLEASVDDVRRALVHGLEKSGFAAAHGSGHRVRARGASATLHHSVLWRGLVVSIRFEPPVDRAASRHFLHWFAKRFDVVDVSSDDA